ncbi:MAG TPA: hypothetical protein VGK74_23740 [Symbiobacteriaceae bacterium]|jgi:hypothetical protein
MPTEKQKVAPAQGDQPKQTPTILDAQLPKKLADLLSSVTVKDLRGPESAAETLKGNTNTPNVWVYSPAVFKFSSLAQKRLTRVARQAGMQDTQVTRVHAQLIGDSNTVLIKPADALDLTAFENPNYRGVSGGVCNLFDLLGPARCTVETGYRQKYDVHMVPQGSAFWPGLLVDLDDPRERKLLPKRKKKSSSTGETKSSSGETKSATKDQTSST